MPPSSAFYDTLAAHYHLLFEDWPASIDRQAAALAPLLASRTFSGPLHILDCACGIGTQALGFASLGHRVTGTDLSPAAIDRARREAKARSLDISFQVADMSVLENVSGPYDVVAAVDNALPHLPLPQLEQAVSAIAARLKPGGLFLASIRDYDSLIPEHPSSQPPAFLGPEGARRIVHQIWDWTSPSTYTLHLHLTLQTAQGWQAHHFVSTYHALLRAQLSAILQQTGFTDVEWLMPPQTGFYQPLVLARLPSSPAGRQIDAPNPTSDPT